MMMSDLSHDLVEEILCRVPITSLRAMRSTCKLWNTLSKSRVLCKSGNLFFGLMNCGIFSMRFNLHEFLKEDREEFYDLSIKSIDRSHISDVFCCGGLLLCVTSNNSSLLVWNPYLGQTRWIQLKNNDRTSVTYAFGYDKNKNHKILSLYQEGYYEIYDLKSNLWSSFDVVIPNWTIKFHGNGVSLSGNTYFMSWDRNEMEDSSDFLLCFDFTRERFGQIIPLPETYTCGAPLSSVKEEKLAVLYDQQPKYTIMTVEIWLTTKIEPNAASWSKFLIVDMDQFTGISDKFRYSDERFFIDEEMKIAVIFSLEESDQSSRAYNSFSQFAFYFSFRFKRPFRKTSR